MATYIVAVSGGVDSVVLLDMMSKTQHRVIVGHFDHGIREDSRDDARFVEALAAKYNYEYVTQRAELGAGASEDHARRARYAFLIAEAKRRQGCVMTAHHRDDLVETIAINLVRGTGWRGLAVLDRREIVRPLLRYPKSAIYDYALRHRLEWVEDSTNHSKQYLRNRLRDRVHHVPEDVAIRVAELRHQQCEMRSRIEQEVATCAKQYGRSRYMLTQIDATCAKEIVRYEIEQQTGILLTWPQIERALLAVKTARTHTKFEAGGGVELDFDARFFGISLAR